jgi:hypothetical protein
MLHPLFELESWRVVCHYDPPSPELPACMDHDPLLLEWHLTLHPLFELKSWRVVRYDDPPSPGLPGCVDRRILGNHWTLWKGAWRR